MNKDDETYIAVGSSGARWKALQDGKAQAALLTMPVDLDAAAKGFVEVAPRSPARSAIIRRRRGGAQS